MKLAIIIIVSLVLGIAAAAGVFFLMGGEIPEKEKMTRLPPPSESVVDHWPIEIGSLAFPTYRGGQVSGFTFAKITFTLRGDYDDKFLDPYIPAIKDKILRKYFKENIPMTRSGLEVDYLAIEKEVQKLIDNMFLPGLVLNTKVEFSPG